jgi:plastocyanin
MALLALALVSLAACGTPATDTQPTAVPTPTTVSQSTNSDQSANPPPIATQPSDMQGMTETPANSSNGSSNAPSPASTTQAAAPTAGGDAQVNDLQSSSVTQVQGNLREWAIDLSQSTVPAGKVQFTVTNQSMMGHNFTVKDASGNTVGGTPTFSNSDGPQTFTVDLQPGTYTIICTLPGHAQRGQRAELTVK